MDKPIWAREMDNTSEMMSSKMELEAENKSVSNGSVDAEIVQPKKTHRNRKHKKTSQLPEKLSSSDEVNPQDVEPVESSPVLQGKIVSESTPVSPVPEHAPLEETGFIAKNVDKVENLAKKLPVVSSLAGLFFEKARPLIGFVDQKAQPYISPVETYVGNFVKSVQTESKPSDTTTEFLLRIVRKLALLVICQEKVTLYEANAAKYVDQAMDKIRLVKYDLVVIKDRWTGRVQQTVETVTEYTAIVKKECNTDSVKARVNTAKECVSSKKVELQAKAGYALDTAGKYVELARDPAVLKQAVEQTKHAVMHPRESVGLVKDKALTLKQQVTGLWAAQA